ncbi:phosphotransferase [Serinicoccus kebangsaanensis]|uniref:phosphotransferase n=1 Tax=Serinicoccus kebangsaanensis TaxID=2602069 RepID=UPI001EE20B37|nr:phosphotransferase [Serinicoccus kebangsaanensis]
MRTDLALAALASAAVPGMKPVAVAGLGVEAGEESELQQAVVEDATGRRWLVRSPLTSVAGARLRRNDELVRQLSRHVPFKVPAAVGYAATGAEGHAAVYPHVEGSTLDFTHLPGGAGLAHAVGRTMAAIHNIPSAVFEQQDVPSFDAGGCRQRLISEVDRAAETGRVPTRLLGRWEEAFEAAPLWQFASTPVHGAFRGAAVVVAFADDEADSGRVVAVTDWDEAMIGDPAADLADLYTRASPAAWESVLDSYALARAQRPDPYLHARARLLAETGRLRGLAHHTSLGDEDAVRRVVEALRRMDRLTEDEDSLVPTTARGPGAVASGAGASGAGASGSGASDAVATDAGPGLAAAGPPPPAEDDRQDADGHPDRAEPDEDITAEVPLPGAGVVGDGPAADEGDEPDGDEADGAGASEAEPPDDEPGGEPEPEDPGRATDERPDGSAPDAVPDQPDVEPDVTAPATDGQPGGPGVDEAPDDLEVGQQPGAAEREAQDSGDVGETEDSEDADAELEDDDTRLHDLYGMPSEDDERRG